ncbi:RabGAP/TBC [Annulohypoxylon maeteangense]|uniref:RabGAP/TBC n=1 Tax=Annulohypoxylon maeteangense TaxID=1927788 RepID=UPI0020078642|nr:RabGAP/TBC [Annulohypoxylon maeteangense]KAI0887274.1 RabGAP/TBC [Annulohypoxylon maeteangense]
MRTLVEATIRWQETLKYSTSLTDLQRAVKDNGPSSPCISGCRSICWKAFLLSQSTDPTSWTNTMLESRGTYASLRDHYLKYIKNPEYLTTVSSDPLADDANSPWNTFRHDEALRAEILQDVQRLPDEPFYHQTHIQTLILDVLFIYCKLNPVIGGYRQGMHELLAPIVYVVEQDAIDSANVASDPSADPRMLENLDSSFVEHDSFAIFSRVMDQARPFYEVGESSANLSHTTSDQRSPTSSIVEKSQYIHEVCLYKADPELSTHLKNIEILPQVFLIRWIRLLFSREFPFDQTLVLWDTLFSVDPSFQLIDLVCTAMLIRIRWDLLNADYTVALQLLLRYPPPQPSHGPHTFVDDAVYLKDHLDPVGGSTLIVKYTGKPPSPSGTASGASTPKSSTSNIRRRLAGARSPLSPSRFKPPQASMEALFQGAAKNVLERGEKLGINQAVRDAMVEIRRNVQEAKSSMKASRDHFAEPGSSNTAVRAVAMFDRRNRRLAALLEEPISSLKNLSSSDLEDKQKVQDALEIAAARIQFIKIYLEDSTIALPDEEEPVSSISPGTPSSSDLNTDPGPPLSDAVAAMALNPPVSATEVQNIEGANSPSADPPIADPDKMDTDDPLDSGTSSTLVDKTTERPQAPVPTRSSLAQSSFSWMLESDSSSSSQKPPIFPSKSTGSHRKRPSANASHERTAFLFGEVSADESGQAVLPENIFDLEEMRKSKT